MRREDSLLLLVLRLAAGTFCCGGVPSGGVGGGGGVVVGCGIAAELDPGGVVATALCAVPTVEGVEDSDETTLCRLLVLCAIPKFESNQVLLINK